MSLQRQYSSKIQGKKVKVGDEDDANNNNNNNLKLVFDFLKEANDDILLEIFVRLPNCRSAILFGSVCRYWHSLISGPQFVPRFISHHREHQDRYSMPYTIIFRKADRIGLGSDIYYYYLPLCKLFSEESMFLHGNSAMSATYLDLPCPMVIRASCNDLLLMYPDGCEYLGSEWSSDDLYICNPITKQFYRLPEFDRPSGWYRVTGHALICMPTTELELPTNHFKVVEFYDLGRRDEDDLEAQPFCHVMSIFCSKTGKWVRECFQCPPPNRFSPYIRERVMEEIVTCNEIVYWLENYGDIDRVIALNLWNLECGVIVFPDDFMWFRQPEDVEGHSFLWRYRRYGGCHVKEQIGVVCGELRLIQVVLTEPRFIPNLKIWKYDNIHKEWVLVHDKKNLRRPSSNDYDAEQFVVPFVPEQKFTGAFVHPTNGEVVLLVWDEKIYQHNLNIMEEDDVFEMMGELDEALDIKYRTEQAQQFGWKERLVSLPIVHPPWPTSLPSN